MLGSGAILKVVIERPLGLALDNKLVGLGHLLEQCVVDQLGLRLFLLGLKIQIRVRPQHLHARGLFGQTRRFWRKDTFVVRLVLRG